MLILIPVWHLGNLRLISLILQFDITGQESCTLATRTHTSLKFEKGINLASMPDGL